MANRISPAIPQPRSEEGYFWPEPLLLGDEELPASQPHSPPRRRMGFSDNSTSTQTQTRPTLNDRVKVLPPLTAKFSEESESEKQIRLATDRYRKAVTVSLKAIADPLQRALFLIGQYKKLSTNPELQATLATQIRFIYAPRSPEPDDYLLVPNEAGIFARKYLTHLCAESNAQNPLTGLVKWILLQSLFLVRQIEILALTPKAVEPKVVHRQLIEITNFISSLPQDFDSPISEIEDINLALIKGLLFEALKILLFQNDPLPASFNLEEDGGHSLAAMGDFLKTSEALARLQKESDNKYPLNTLPSIFTMPRAETSKEVDFTQLTKAQMLLHNKDAPMTIRLIALCRFIHYSSDPVLNKGIPEDLLGMLDCNIGRILYPNHPNTTSNILNDIGFACRKNANNYRYLCLHGAILSVYESIRACVLDATSSTEDNPSDLSEPVNSEDPKALNFFHLHSFYVLLKELRNLRSLLFNDEAISQAAQTLDDGLEILNDATTDILNGSLRAEMEPYMQKWDILAGLNQYTYLEDSMRSADYLIKLHEYFLLRRLVIMSSNLKSDDPQHLVFKFLTHFNRKDRTRFSQGACSSPESPYKKPRDLWMVAMDGPEKEQQEARTFLTSKTAIIKEEARKALREFEAANKKSAEEPSHL